jgi:flagellar biosynthesis/type III secretory pathway protein FliH
LKPCTFAEKEAPPSDLNHLITGINELENWRRHLANHLTSLEKGLEKRASRKLIQQEIQDTPQRFLASVEQSLKRNRFLPG